MKQRYTFRAQPLSAPTWCPLKFKTRDNPLGDPDFTALLEHMYAAGGIWHFRHHWHGMLLDTQALEHYLTSTGLRLYLAEETGFDQGFLWREGA